jgi:hypothetical protein
MNELKYADGFRVRISEAERTINKLTGPTPLSKPKIFEI